MKLFDFFTDWCLPTLVIVAILVLIFVLWLSLHQLGVQASACPMGTAYYCPTNASRSACGCW